MPWIQVYDPLASAWLRTVAAAVPIVLLLAAPGSAQGSTGGRLGMFGWMVPQ